MTKSTPKGITFYNGTYRARIKRGNQWFTRPGRHELKDAIADLEELTRTHGEAKQGRARVSETERKRRLKEQLATLPPWETMRNIQTTKCGFLVSLRRRSKEVIYGGHFPKLLDAIARRDELELIHTKK